MNCILVDDNKLDQTALKQLISRVDFLTLKEEFSNAHDAFNYLTKEPIDLVFLDIEMPGMSGLELVSNLKERPIIIFITAKKEYAVEAFELNVADYIVKPINPSRFNIAVSRAKELFDLKEQKVESIEKDKNYIFVRNDSLLTKIKVSDIIYIQALGDYVNIFTQDKRYTVHITLGSIEKKLASGSFYRLHRSFLISLNHIDNIEERTAYIGKHPIPIAVQFKKELLDKLNLI
ncbi:MAG TPA: LytTR family DNA-binding domain-containing protein [Nitrosopumilaceae archaeon]|nr:LytTR family DNA-binding domain-containing protein [Nitrosopumilaceae archaeon]